MSVNLAQCQLRHLQPMKSLIYMLVQGLSLIWMGL